MKSLAGRQRQNRLARSVASTDRASQLTPIPDPQPINLCGISKSFAKRGSTVHVFSDLSMVMPAGQTTTLVGPSGCGKSTLLLVIAGLEPVSGGTARIGDAVITAPYEGLGIAFQRDLLLPGRTVLQNVLLEIELLGSDPRAYEPYARELLTLTGLGAFERFYPQQLSGGMRQRAALCRALVHNPSVLLLDEPFAAVDALTREALAVEVEALFAERLSPTIVLVTHSIDEAVFMSDSVYVLSRSPARILKHIAIELPRPRVPEHRKTREFWNYVTEIRGALEEPHND